MTMGLSVRIPTLGSALAIVGASYHSGPILLAPSFAMNVHDREGGHAPRARSVCTESPARRPGRDTSRRSDDMTTVETSSAAWMPFVCPIVPCDAAASVRSRPEYHPRR